MRAWAVCACAVVLLGAGCGGSKANSAGEPERQARAASSGGVQVVVGRATTGLAGVPAAALPGITVLGTAQESAKPDRAQVSLSIGTGSELGPGGPTFALVEQKEIDPVLDALKKAGAEQLTLDRFGRSAYGSQGGAEIHFAVSRPDEVEKTIDAAQATLRKQTDYDLQDASVVFGLSDCEPVEQKAWTAAVADARTRAERLADLSGVKLGNVLAVSEATISSSPYAPATTGCQALEQPPTAAAFLLSPVENTEEKATVAVTLQVTFAVVSK